MRALRWSLSPLGWLALVVYLRGLGTCCRVHADDSAQLPADGAGDGRLAGRSGAARRTRPGAWLGLAAAMKPFLLLFAPYCAIRRDTRALAALLAAAGALLAIGLIVFGPGAYREWVEQLPRVTWATHYMNASVFAVAERVLGRTTIPGLDLSAAARPWCWLSAIAADSVADACGRTAHQRRRGRDRSRLGRAAAGRAARLAARLGLLPLDRALARRRA